MSLKFNVFRDTSLFKSIGVRALTKHKNMVPRVPGVRVVIDPTHDNQTEGFL